MRHAQRSALTRLRPQQSGFLFTQSCARGNSSLRRALTFVVFPADGKDLSSLQRETHTRPYSRQVDDVHASPKCHDSNVSPRVHYHCLALCCQLRSVSYSRSSY